MHISTLFASHVSGYWRWSVSYETTASLSPSLKRSWWQKCIEDHDYFLSSISSVELFASWVTQCDLKVLRENGLFRLWLAVDELLQRDMDLMGQHLVPPEPSSRQNLDLLQKGGQKEEPRFVSRNKGKWAAGLWTFCVGNSHVFYDHLDFTNKPCIDLVLCHYCCLCSSSSLTQLGAGGNLLGVDAGSRECWSGSAMAL